MDTQLFLYNSLTRKKEKFQPIKPPSVGLYVCGPTVYGEGHLGHARSAITFDLLFRYLQHLKYKVRYVRNITDVGHLVNDADEGEDKIAKKAKLEQLEPMEIVQHYTNVYHDNMRDLNLLPPSIEPHASGHIIEQQQMVQDIIDAGFAYEVNGSIYFDVEAYSKKHQYGKLSGRVLEDLMANTRELEGQQDKKNPFDFALWKKAEPQHIMRWPSVWSEGFPGWHLECSAMSTKYLGEEFDIHGGGMDLLFPHHECEIAQSVAANGKESVKLWMHNNMITINGQKMGKSLGNAVSLNQFFSGDHPLLEKAYTPMVVRFFILQAHYRSTLDFSNEALQASEKGFLRLMEAIQKLDLLKVSESTTVDISGLKKKCYDAMNDDMNSPILIANLFDGVRIINSIVDGKETIAEKDLKELKNLFHIFAFEVLGLKHEELTASDDGSLKNVVDLLLNLRIEAKKKKDFETADQIRNKLQDLGFEIKDTKDGFEWKKK